VLSNPLNFKRAVALTEHQFRFGFTNAVTEQEAKELYAKYAMPAPGRPLFQAATATLNPYSATKVNVANANRGPSCSSRREGQHRSTRDGEEHAQGVPAVACRHRAQGVPRPWALADHR